MAPPISSGPVGPGGPVRNAGAGNAGKKAKTEKPSGDGGRVVADKVSAAQGANIPSKLAGLVRSDLDRGGARSVGNSVKKGLSETTHNVTNTNPGRLSSLQS